MWVHMAQDVPPCDSSSWPGLFTLTLPRDSLPVTLRAEVRPVLLIRFTVRMGLGESRVR